MEYSTVFVGSEFRAHAQELLFEFAIGRGSLYNAYQTGGFTVGRMIEFLYPGVLDCSG
ncbi:MAG: hypothetical protein R3C53_17690 [Pirellulaceae bacterium]